MTETMPQTRREARTDEVTQILTPEPTPEPEYPHLVGEYSPMPLELRLQREATKRTLIRWAGGVALFAILWLPFIIAVYTYVPSN